MSNWSRSDKIALAGVIATAAGSVAALLALGGSPKQGIGTASPPAGGDPTAPQAGPGASTQAASFLPVLDFVTPQVTWGRTEMTDQAPLEVAYASDGSVRGYGAMLDPASLEGCTPPREEVFTVVSPLYGSDQVTVTGFVGQAASGKRENLYMEPDLAQRLSNAAVSWLPEVIRTGRRVLASYVMCGSGGITSVDRVLAE